MKLLRYGESGRERPGLLDRYGHIRDLGDVIPDVGPAALDPESLLRLALLDPETLPKVAGTPRLGPPLTGVGKIVGIGLNFADHAQEAGLPLPTEPVMFLKATTAITGPHDPIFIPPGSEKTDWELELSVVIGKTARRVTPEQALSHVAGYCAALDLSERHWQLERGTQWTKGKGFDTFAPIGPWLVTADEIPEPQALPMRLALNGEIVQNGSTSRMVFGIAHLVSYVSALMTLMPGDMIFTGTPAGVGMGRRPPRYLQPGDALRGTIEGLGEQAHPVLATPA